MGLSAPIPKRKDRAEQPKRLLVDSVVGAHALLMTYRLLTLDANRYRTAYPELRLMLEGVPQEP